MESNTHEMSTNKKNFYERVWIVQANNKYFNFEKALRDNTLNKWTVTQLNGKWNRSLIDAPKLFKIEIKKNDIILIWKSTEVNKENAGFIGIGIAKSDVRAAPVTDIFTREQLKEKRSGITRNSIYHWVDFELNMLLDPEQREIVSKKALKQHTVLQYLSIVNNPQGTNFGVLTHEAEILCKLVPEWSEFFPTYIKNVKEQDLITEILPEQTFEIEGIIKIIKKRGVDNMDDSESPPSKKQKQCQDEDEN